jgi:hypothetical protein
MELTLKIVDAKGDLLAAASGQGEVILVHRRPYREGDCILIESSGNGHVSVCLDEAVAPAVAYLREPSHRFAVPFGERRRAYSPKAFGGDLHRIRVHAAHADQIAARRNLALNPWDDHLNAALFPHASANVETRGEAVFAARNAIDGERASDNHGFWPYTSWGINRDPQARLKIEFGRAVLVDELLLYLRADFPHDSWWEKASVTFSNGETLRLALQKSAKAQSFTVPPRIVEWIELHDLIKADDPSPFPALTQIEVWGRDLI